MKRIVALSLLASASLVTKNHTAAPAVDLPTHGQQETQYTKEIASVEDLETFLKSQYGSNFPENNWGLFSAPYRFASPPKSKNTLNKEKIAAFPEVPWIVLVAFYAFDKVAPS